jgi:hypothetical protein
LQEITAQRWTKTEKKSRPPGLDRAGWSDTSTYMGTPFLQEQHDMFTMPLNQGLAPNLVGGPRRLGKYQKTHKSMPR